MSPADHKLLAEAGGAPPGPPHTFATAWRNYLKSFFTRGFFYKLSSGPSLLYVSENKTLGGKEERSYEGEGLGRKLAVTFFEQAGEGEGLVQRVEKAGLAMTPRLLTVAEVLQAWRGVPADPTITAADAEILFEAQYENLEVVRMEGTVEPDAAEVHTYRLGEEVLAEAAFAADLGTAQRTKMVLARCLQRNAAFLDGETLQAAWALPVGTLQARAAQFLPAVPLAPPRAPPPPAAAPPAPPAAGKGGRGRARGGRGPPALEAHPAPPAAGKGGRGRARARGRGR